MAIGQGYNSLIGTRASAANPKVQEYYNTQNQQGFANPDVLASFVNQNFAGSNANSGNVFSLLGGNYTKPVSSQISQIDPATGLPQTQNGPVIPKAPLPSAATPSQTALTVSYDNGQLKSTAGPQPVPTSGYSLGTTGVATKNPVAYPYSGTTPSSASPNDYKFTSEQDFQNRTGLGDFSSVQVLNPGQSPTSPYYKFSNQPQVFQNSNYQPGSSPTSGSSNQIQGSFQTNGYANADGSPYQQVSTVSNPTTDTSTFSGNPTTNNDIQALLQKNLDSQDAIIQQITSAIGDPAVLKAQQDALNAGQEVSNFDTSVMGGMSNIMKKPIALEFQQGQEAALTRDSAFTRSSLVNQAQYYQNVLQNATATRQQKIDAGKFLYDASRNKLSDTISLYKATAPENIGTNYNPTTGLLTATTRNPLTGEMTVSALGNIGAQKTYTSTNVTTDPNTGQLIFVGTDAAGNVISQPITGGGLGGAGPTSNNFGGFGTTTNASGQVYRTDRNNNPIAAAVTTGGSNQFTQALDQAGIKWSYGDSFGTNMSTINVQGDPVEASRAILANTNALQGWYAQHTGKDIMAQTGIRNNTDFAKASPEAQNAVIQGIYKAENGGHAANLFTQPNSQQNLQNLPPALQGAVKSINGMNYFDGGQLADVSQIKMAQYYAAQTGISYVPTANADKLQHIDVTMQNLQQMQADASKFLSGGLLGRLKGITLNQLESATQSNPDIAAFKIYRDTAINAIQSLAAGQGQGFRLNDGEIKIAASNLPSITDNIETANTKISLTMSLMNKWIAELLPGASNHGSNDPLNILP